MKKTFLFLICAFMATFLFAQENPIVWKTKAEKITENEYKISLIGTIQTGWYIYSQYLASDDGPVRTTIEFDKDGYETIGKTDETGHKKEGFDEMFGMNVIKFSDEIIFTQKIKVNSNVKNIKTKLNYMTCNNEVCLPPKDVNLDVFIK